MGERPASNRCRFWFESRVLHAYPIWERMHTFRIPKMITRENKGPSSLVQNNMTKCLTSYRQKLHHKLSTYDDDAAGLQPRVGRNSLTR